MFEADKYVVVKREDWDHLVEQAPVAFDVHEDLEAVQNFIATLSEQILDPTTTFVLRERDIIGFGTLRLYASNAVQMIEMADAGMLSLTGEQREHLMDVADGAVGLADKWQQAQHKIPD